MYIDHIDPENCQCLKEVSNPHRQHRPHHQAELERSSELREEVRRHNVQTLAD
jgi:hypothetical protein